MRYGASYRAAYALIESDDRRLIVRINDVGPLAPGRVIDLNERAMRFFDATLERGLLPSVRITPLDGSHWTPGPVDDDGAAVAVAMALARQIREQPARDEPVREQVAINLN